MRKSLGMLLAAAMVVGAFGAPAADAKKKKKKAPKKTVRMAESTYDTPAIGYPGVVAGCSGSTGCASFAIGPDERYVMLEIEDTTGTSTFAEVGQDLDGDGFVDNTVPVCGTTAEPLLVEPGFELTMFISAFPGASPACPGLGTTGTVVATISNLP